MRNKILRLQNPVMVFAHDMLMIPIAWILAYLLWFNFDFTTLQLSQAVRLFPILFLVQIFFYWYFGLYRGVWRFASIQDLWRIIKAVILGCVVSILIFFFLLTNFHMSRAIFPLYGMILIALLSGSRLIYRVLKERSRLAKHLQRVVIIGAGSAGEMLVRDLLRSDNHAYKPVVFIDDDPRKQGKEIHGIRVVGFCEDLLKVVTRYKIEFAIIAIPIATTKEMRRIVELCRTAGISSQTVPSLGELASGNVTVNMLREVAVEDLLGREEVEIDWQDVQKNIQDKVVLVSGGGGSIGSELCKQIARAKPALLAVVDNSEYNLYKLQQDLVAQYPLLNYSLHLGSITDKAWVTKVVGDLKPNFIFHAAAYKHVPILENQVYSAITNNIFGTKILADLAVSSGADKFILISTDKAVNPNNMLGATKRLAELICQEYKDQARTKFIAVRFGNVLGSSGSVLPLFRQQLANGGPLTVTHQDVSRFFMTIPEACHLILQACVLSSGGEIFVLDMGEPVKIWDLAEQLIRLSGKEPNVDIKIVATGLREGEKLHEELFYKDENIVRTNHKKIFLALPRSNFSQVLPFLMTLESALSRHENPGIIQTALMDFLREFKLAD